MHWSSHYKRMSRHSLGHDDTTAVLQIPKSSWSRDSRRGVWQRRRTSPARCSGSGSARRCAPQQCPHPKGRKRTGASALGNVASLLCCCLHVADECSPQQCRGLPARQWFPTYPPSLLAPSLRVLRGARGHHQLGQPLASSPRRMRSRSMFQSCGTIPALCSYLKTGLCTWAECEAVKGNGSSPPARAPQLGRLGRISQ